jgi:hypothetical protein
MDTLLKGTTWVSFEELVSLDAPLQCVPVVTAALLAGYKLAPTNAGQVGNIEHAFLGDGLNHPRHIKDMRPGQIRRIIALRFQATLVTVVGVEMRLEEFVAFWQQDEGLRAHFEKRGDWDKNLAIIDTKIRASEPVVKAGWDGRRTVMVPLRAQGDGGRLRKLLVDRYDRG